MPRNYRIERDAIIQRWYGVNAQSRNPRPRRSWKEGPVTPSDCFGIPVPVNAPFRLFGHCLVWKYGLDRGGYGVLTIDGKRELAHRAVFVQTRGPIPEDRQVNHLCNRPYCIQPSHLYAGTSQDNKDDSQIFTKEELLNAPGIFLWQGQQGPDDPLQQRLLESSRYDETEPWEPVVQSAQKPLEEFTCPNHEFAITMFGGESRICRICETSEYEERLIDGLGTHSLIAEICPASRSVVPIFEKIASSEYLKEAHRDTRRLAYNRSRRGYGMDAHDLRRCACEYCIEDRKNFRAAIQPLLTKSESKLLDVHDRLEPQITAPLDEASTDIMAAWAGSVGLDGQEIQTLRRHRNNCINSNSELVRTTRVLEGDLSYLLYAISEFESSEEMLGDQQVQLIMLRWRLAQMRKADEGQSRHTILPAAIKTADRIALAWQTEADGILRPFLESKPDLHQVIDHLARALITMQVLELLRFEFFGRNSHTEQEPHPHEYCAAAIRETGRARPFLREFEEGLGFRPKPT